MTDNLKAKILKRFGDRDFQFAPDVYPMVVELLWIIEKHQKFLEDYEFYLTEGPIDCEHTYRELVNWTSLRLSKLTI